MGLTGDQLEAAFGSGFSAVKSITGFNHPLLNRPSSPIADDTADVQEQQVETSVDFNAATGELKLTAAANGEGLWIPYLGNGKGTEGDKGWGTYSKVVSQASWVATGPFSGCFVAAFLGPGMRFAHLITPAHKYTAASVDQQIASIERAAPAPLYAKWPMDGSGLGLAFFLKIGGAWHRRFVWVGPGGNVMQMNAKSAPI
jgi:hypothetical protein